MRFKGNSGSWLAMGLKQSWRDFRAGDLRILLIAVAIAVAAVSSVGFMSDRVSRALERDATRLLGADLVIQTSQQVPDQWLAQAHSMGLKAIRQWQFPSMVALDSGEMQLASVKAVEDGYPLRGQLRVTRDLTVQSDPVAHAPDVGTVWVDPQLLAMLGLSMGDSLHVGQRNLRIDRAITYEPDRGVQFVNVAPRVLIRAEDLQTSGLLSEGSRAGYSLLVAGPEDKVKAFRQWIEPKLVASQKILSIDDGRPELRRTLDRAHEFLSLVVMIAVLIASVAIALGARRFCQRQQTAVAVMRCLGARRSEVRKILMLEFAAVAVAGTAIGLTVGWFSHLGLIAAMQEFVAQDLPEPGLEPAMQGLYAGFWLLFAFSFPALQALDRVTPRQIFSQQVPNFPMQSIWGYVLAFGGFALLMVWIAGSMRYGFALAAGFVMASVLFGLLTMAILKMLALLRKKFSLGLHWHFALAGMIRRKVSTIAQTSALAIGMMAILLLTIVRTDLLNGWQQTLPPDAPNRFLINVMPDQLEPVQGWLDGIGVKDAHFYPMVRGRLIKKNGKVLESDDFSSQRAQRLLQREFNLTYQDRLDDPGQIVAGNALDPHKNEVSMELSVAKELGFSLGDEIVFEVAGQEVPVTVTSLRQVDWDSMKPNFFAVLTPSALADHPQTFMTAFYLPIQDAAKLQSLVREFPNLTVFDVGAILVQLQSVLERVSVAIQGLFVFAMLAGAVVLAAALGASRDERIREAVLLRVLGATQKQLVSSQCIELLCIGAVAGLLAAFGATLAAWALAKWVFEFNLNLSVTPWILGVGVCMVASWMAGTWALRGVLSTPPLQILREV